MDQKIWWKTNQNYFWLGDSKFLLRRSFLSPNLFQPSVLFPNLLRDCQASFFFQLCNSSTCPPLLCYVKQYYAVKQFHVNKQPLRSMSMYRAPVNVIAYLQTLTWNMISVIQDRTQQLLHCTGVKIKTPCQVRHLLKKAATKKNVVFWNIER